MPQTTSAINSHNRNSSQHGLRATRGVMPSIEGASPIRVKQEVDERTSSPTLKRKESEGGHDTENCNTEKRRKSARQAGDDIVPMPMGEAEQAEWEKKFGEFEALRQSRERGRTDQSIVAGFDALAVGTPQELDQYFTKPEVAKECVLKVMSFLRKDGVDLKNATFVEPSAGGCAFVQSILDYLNISAHTNMSREDALNNIIACDLDTRNAPQAFKDMMREGDFLKVKSKELKDAKKVRIFIGNPPFGKGGELALQFVNHARKLGAEYVAFILPMTFENETESAQRWQVKGMKLVSSEALPADSFQLPNGKTKSYSCVFQIWQKGKAEKYEEKEIPDGLWIRSFEKGKLRSYKTDEGYKTLYMTPIMSSEAAEMQFTDSFEDAKKLSRNNKLFSISIDPDEHSPQEVQYIEARLNGTDWYKNSRKLTHIPGYKEVSHQNIASVLSDIGDEIIDSEIQFTFYKKGVHRVSKDDADCNLLYIQISPDSLKPLVETSYTDKIKSAPYVKIWLDDYYSEEDVKKVSDEISKKFSRGRKITEDSMGKVLSDIEAEFRIKRREEAKTQEAL